MAFLIILLLSLYSCSTSPVRDEIVDILGSNDTLSLEEDITNSTILNSTTIPLSSSSTSHSSMSYTKFTMQESMAVARTNEEGEKKCLTFYRHVANDDYSHEGICTLGNCFDDPDIVDCKTHFPEKFEDDVYTNENK